MYEPLKVATEGQTVQLSMEQRCLKVLSHLWPY